MGSRTLFVCTFMGVRSCLAEEILRNLAGPEPVIASSGLESGRIGELVRETARRKNLYLPPESPPTVFDRFRAGETFDQVIVLCGEGSLEQCSLLRACVMEMYGSRSIVESWSIPDFSRVRGTEDEMVAQWLALIDRIEKYCRRFLEKHGSQVFGPLDGSGNVGA